ncbi:putative gamma-glutamylcyclotransferase [Fusarium sp. Ph1]|nr:putative gamma-glutamylcyclotransferase [Fusarium sp. Ph1]
MDVLNELEAMANAVSLAESNKIDNDTVYRWQSLFGYSESEAHDKIKECRSSSHDFIVPDSHWDMARDQKQQEGFDRVIRVLVYCRCTQAMSPINTDSEAEAETSDFNILGQA